MFQNVKQFFKSNSANAAKNGAPDQRDAKAIEKASSEIKSFLRQPPTKEEFTDWINRDIEAAHFLLGILRTSPNIKQLVIDELYEMSRNAPAPVAADDLDTDTDGRRN